MSLLITEEVFLRNEWLSYNHSHLKLPSYCYWTYHSINIESNKERIKYWKSIKTFKKFKDWNKKQIIVDLISKLS